MEVPNLGKSVPFSRAQPRTSDGITALGTAIYKNYLEIVKLLLKHGAQVNDEDGGTSFSSGTVHFVVTHWQLALSPKECVHSKGFLW